MAASPQLYRLKRLSWPFPQWWSLSLSMAAWLMILWRANPLAMGLQSTQGHGGHDMMMDSISMMQGEQTVSTAGALSVDAFWWLIMVAAMMFPMVLEPIRITAARSLWGRRHRAISGFLLGYLIPWSMFGIAASVIISALGVRGRAFPLAALGFGAALLWQLTPAKRRAVLACHRTLPIAPSGWRADRDCVRYGLTVGRSCLMSCWALMLACLLAGHSIPAMICATSVGWAERHRAARPNHLLLCGVIAVFALIYLVLPYLSA